MRGKQRSPSSLIASITTVAWLLVGQAIAAAQPGEGKTLRVGRATWDTGWFHAALYIQAFKDLGYTIDGPTTLKNPALYQSISQGDLDFTVNGWFPLHNTYLEKLGDGIELVGYVARGGALQGYLIDKATHEKHGVDNIEDFKDPKVKRLFDTDNDGKAELVACPPGWGCELQIEHHVDVYGLQDHVDTIKAEYSVSMADTIGRYRTGESVFFYAWTPSWTLGVLELGKDVVWIEVPYPSLTEAQKEFEGVTTVEDVPGCVDDPCEIGWPVNDIRPVLNAQFAKDNPAARRLFEVASVPLEDIFTQNMKMFTGEDSKEDIERHARQWIAENHETYETWLEQAQEAAK